MKTFYFTGTGNSLYVAKTIGGEICSIPKMLKDGKREFEDEAIGFVFPCYGFGVPRIVLDFIEKSKFKADYFFAVMTYGNMASGGLYHIEQIGARAGIKFDYTNEILMIDNYLPMFDMRAQLRKENEKNIEVSLRKIVEDIQTRKRFLTRKGLGAEFVSKLVRPIQKFMVDNADKRFIIRDNCNGCGMCKNVCPKDNIVIEGKPRFLHKCESCYACIHHCPQTALHLKSERSDARFINQNVKLKEIIESNNKTVTH